MAECLLPQDGGQRGGNLDADGRAVIRGAQGVRGCYWSLNLSSLNLPNSAAFRASNSRCSAAMASIFALCSDCFATVKAAKIAKIATATRKGFRRVNSRIRDKSNENLCPHTGHDAAFSARLLLQLGQGFIGFKL